MPYRSWVLTTHQTGKPHDVWVYLYDTLKEMRRDCVLHAKEHHADKAEPFDHTEAICHGLDYRESDDGGKTWTRIPPTIILRFASGHVTPEIVSHEVAHASQYLYRLDLIPPHASAKQHFTNHNEDFAYLLGDLFANVWELVTTG